jgi:protein farnesyltransferase/geranylgeranyltransferase type-1 subunit alpha
MPRIICLQGLTFPSPKPKVERLIEEDVRNNSAWNGRWLTVHKRKQSDVLDIDVARQEADFAIQKAAQDPYNESPWRYLVGILKEQQRRDSKEVIPLAAEYEAKAYGVRLVLVETSHDPDACVNLNASRIDLLEMIVSQESLERVRYGLALRCSVSRLLERVSLT